MDQEEHEEELEMEYHRRITKRIDGLKNVNEKVRCESYRDALRNDIYLLIAELLLYRE